jgi:hypothetical protein
MTTATRPVSTASVKLVHQRPTGRDELVEIDVLAHDAGVHPGLAARFVRLGLLAPAGARGDVPPRFSPDAATRLARAIRLRRDLGLNYAGAVLACELLARIDELEQRLARYERPGPRVR